MDNYIFQKTKIANQSLHFSIFLKNTVQKENVKKKQ